MKRLIETEKGTLIKIEDFRAVIEKNNTHQLSTTITPSMVDKVERLIGKRIIIKYMIEETSQIITTSLYEIDEFGNPINQIQESVYPETSIMGNIFNNHKLTEEFFKHLKELLDDLGEILQASREHVMYVFLSQGYYSSIKYNIFWNMFDGFDLRERKFGK